MKEFYNRLLNKYHELQDKERLEKNCFLKDLYSDELRKIKATFEKTFHKSIDKAEKM